MYEGVHKETSKFILQKISQRKRILFLVPRQWLFTDGRESGTAVCEKYAPFVLPSGKYSISTGRFGGVLTGQKRYSGEYQTEWEFLKDVLMKNGVPADAVLKEDQATFTWENAKFSRKVTDQAGINIRKAIICCKK